MEYRKKIEEQIIIDINVLPERRSPNRYKPGILWQELINTTNVLPTDIVSEIGYRMVKESGFASMKMEDELEEYPVATLVVLREREETDEEFLKRKQTEEERNRQSLEKERLEYLRLKAKFENTSQSEGSANG